MKSTYLPSQEEETKDQKIATIGSMKTDDIRGSMADQERMDGVVLERVKISMQGLRG
jgi:hypothetical protein